MRFVLHGSLGYEDSLRIAGGPGSGWHAEDGHVPGSQGGKVDKATESRVHSHLQSIGFTKKDVGTAKYKEYFDRRVQYEQKYNNPDGTKKSSGQSKTSAPAPAKSKLKDDPIDSRPTNGKVALSPAERNAVETYVGPLLHGEEGEVGGLNLANIQLREGRKLSGEDAKLARDLKTAIEKAPTTRDAVVYRGIFDEYISHVKEGGTFTDKGFVSTARDKENAEAFGDRVWRVEVPKGTPMLDIDKVLKQDIEGEHLLPPGLTFQVSHKTQTLTVVRKK